MVNKNQGEDLQRTPTYTQPLDFPVPEKDILDPVAEYNKGELAALEIIETKGFSFAQAYGEGLLQATKDVYTDFIQGYWDALEFEGTREI